VLPIAATGGFLPQWLIEEGAQLEPGSSEYWLRVWLFAAMCTGLWWLILSRLLRNQAERLKHLFYPFLQSSSFTYTKFLMIGGLLLLVAPILITQII